MSGELANVRIADRSVAAPYVYDDVQSKDAPEWHREVARCSSMGLSDREIASVLGKRLHLVRKVLSHEPVQRYVETLELRRRIQEQRFQYELSDIIEHGLKDLNEAVRDPKTTVAQKLRIVSFASDRLGSGSMARQTKQHDIKEYRVVQSDKIRELNERASRLGMGQGDVVEADYVELPKVDNSSVDVDTEAGKSYEDIV